MSHLLIQALALAALSSVIIVARTGSWEVAGLKSGWLAVVGAGTGVNNVLHLTPLLLQTTCATEGSTSTYRTCTPPWW